MWELTHRRWCASVVLVIALLLPVATWRSASAGNEDLQDYLTAGLSSYERGDALDALRSFGGGLRLAEEREQEAAVAVFLEASSLVYRSLSQFSEALEYLERAAGIHHRLGDRKSEASALNHIGEIWVNLSQSAAALEYFEKALAIARETGDGEGEAGYLGNLGSAYFGLSQLYKALDYHRQALSVSRRLGSRSLEAMSLGSIGLDFDSLGDSTSALDYYGRALSIFRQVSDQSGEARTLRNIGNVYESVSQYSNARESYAAAAVSASAARDDGILRTSRLDIADLDLVTGAPEAAFKVYSEFDAPEKLGAYYLLVGDSAKALEQYARLLYRNSEMDADIQIATRIGLGRALEAQGDYAAAAEHYRKAVDTLEQQRADLPEELRRHFFAGKCMMFSRMEPYEGLVRVSMNLGAAQEALLWAEHTKARVFLDVVSVQARELRESVTGDLGRQEKDLEERIASAVAERDSALKVANLVYAEEKKAQLEKLHAEREQVAARIRDQYPAYAAMRYPAPLRAEQFELGSGETLLEYEVTQNATYAWVVRGGAIVKTATIEISRPALAALVDRYREQSFMAAPGATVNLKGYDAAAAYELYERLLEPVMSALGAAEASVIVVPDEMIGALPLESLTVRMPTGKLEFASVDATRWYPMDVTYVGNTRTFNYAQSATGLSVSRRLRRSESPILQPRVLVLADPVFDTRDVRCARISCGETQTVSQEGPLDSEARGMRGQDSATVRAVIGQTMGFERVKAAGHALTDRFDHLAPNQEAAPWPRLEKTEALTGRLRALFGRDRVDVLNGLDASEPRLRSQLASGAYDYQIYATHGALEQRLAGGIGQPALVLTLTGTSPEDPVRDGYLTFGDVLGLRLDSKLIALGACQTGLGREVSGEGAMSMGRAFQYAGAKAVVMSLWSVDQEATVTLLDTMFEQIHDGRTPSEALRNAQQHVRSLGWEHPYFWAGFELADTAIR